MNLYKTIQKIQFKESIGVNDFLDATGFSKGMYYDIKNGKKTELKPNQLKKLVDTFPNCEFLLSMNNSDIEEAYSTEVNSSAILKKNGVEITIKEAADFIAESTVNFKEAKKVSNLFNLTVKNDNRDYLINYLESKGFKVTQE